eukprot:scaffold24740_cov66-Attheya_sp.AAC.3
MGNCGVVGINLGACARGPRAAESNEFQVNLPIHFWGSLPEEEPHKSNCRGSNNEKSTPGSWVPSLTATSTVLWTTGGT